MNKPLQQWVINVYYPTLDTSINTSYSYLNTTVNWAISILTAVILFIIARGPFPDKLSWYILSGSLVLITHFAVRAAKGYLNTIRWSTIQREIIKIMHKNEITWEDDDLKAVTSVINLYHLNWISPLSFTTVVYKLLFELGFFYLYFIVITLIFYISARIEADTVLLVVLFLGVLGSLIEFVLLWESPYLRRVKVDKQATRLR